MPACRWLAGGSQVAKAPGTGQGSLAGGEGDTQQGALLEGVLPVAQALGQPRPHAWPGSNPYSVVEAPSPD